MRRLIIAIFVLFAISGCANIITSATNRMTDNLSAAILNQDDPQTVKDGAPAYLLLIDSLIEGEPDNADMLLAGSRLYGAYASVFVDESGRARRLTARSRAYAERAVCIRHKALCAALTAPYDRFQASLQSTDRYDVPVLHGLATAWAGWIQAHSDDWQAVADLPKVEALFERVVELDEGHDGGRAHLYLGVLNTQLPPALGGEPEVARAHFERAIELSEGRDLMTKVLFARHYARLVFDRPLHDRLLQEVIDAEPRAPRLTLTNILAQRDARRLLADAADYF